ncbi:hypothetical protein BGX38DRAFT_1209861 [Terfezia claveryi]|nr:hypothetical protein BGX38DRAFT_1209861 [Terfezia claveryi]
MLSALSSTARTRPICSCAFGTTLARRSRIGAETGVPFSRSISSPSPSTSTPILPIIIPRKAKSTTIPQRSIRTMPPPPPPCFCSIKDGRRRMRISTTTTSGYPAPSTSADLSLPPLPLFKSLTSHPPNKVAIIDYNHPTSTPHAHTYSNLLQSISLGRARLLQLYGADIDTDTRTDELCDLHGARVAFLVGNSFNWVATLFAIWAAGGVAVPLCTSHPLKEMAYVVADSGAGLVLGTREFLEKVEEVVEAVRREKGVQLGGEIRVGGVEGLFSPPPPGEGEEGPAGVVVSKSDIDTSTLLYKRALIIYTSGTTSLPKGVVTTHLNLSAQSASLKLAWNYSPTDHLLHILPLHHVHGILNCTLTPLLSGATIEFLLQPFNAANVLTRLAQGAPGGGREKITLLMAVPTIYTRLLERYHSADMGSEQRVAVTQALSSLRLAVSGSSSLPTSIRSAWAQISGGGTLLERYGMTEVGMAVSCGLDSTLQPAGAVGWVLPGYEGGLRSSSSPNPSGVIAQEGEVLIRGPGVFTEYWNRPSSTTSGEFLPASYIPDTILTPGLGTPFPELEEQAILGVGEGVDIPTPFSPSAYPWFKTGDFARLSSPLPLFTPPLILLGRLTTDILKSGSEKLSALEIEHAILQTSLPISEVAVVGLPSLKWGDLVAAVVVLKPGHGVDEGWDEERVERDLRAELKKCVAGWKVPKVVRVVQTLGRNAMGKVAKRDLVRRVFPGWRGEEN